MLLRRGENGEVCDRARELAVADWMSPNWSVIVVVARSGLGRSDYRSKSAKVAVARRKELAMRRIIGCG